MGRSIFKYTLLLFDLVAIVLSFRIAFGLRYELGLFITRPQIPFSGYWSGITLALGVWIVLFYLMKLDEPVLSVQTSLDISGLALACVVLFVSILSGSFLAGTYYSRLLLVLLFFLLFFTLFCLRLVHKVFVRVLTRYGIGRLGIAIVGSSDIAREIASRIAGRRDLGYELVGFVFPAAGQAAAATGPETFTDADQLARQLKSKRVDNVIFAMPIRRNSETLEFIAACQKYDMNVKFVPEHYELHTTVVEGFSLDGIPLFEIREAGQGFAGRLVKTGLDYFLGILFGILLFPIAAAIALVLFVATKGRVIQRDERIGLGGRPFTLYRFDAGVAGTVYDATWGSRFREFLLRYSLSELPQILNVIKGDMSIVGPRPETLERVQHYSAWHRRRLQLKPGITGLAQVRGLRGFASSEEKTRFDLEYAANFTPLLDLGLITATVGVLLRRRENSDAVKSPAASVEEQRRDLSEPIQEKTVKT